MLMLIYLYRMRNGCQEESDIFSQLPKYFILIQDIYFFYTLDYYMSMRVFQNECIHCHVNATEDITKIHGINAIIVNLS